MAMTTYKYQRLADEFGVTSGPTLAAAVAAGNSTVQLAALCSTSPAHYTNRFNWWDAAIAPFSTPPSVCV